MPLEGLDELVSITRGDLFQLVNCAVSYDSRLPYSIVPIRIWEQLTPQMQRAIEGKIEDAESRLPGHGTDDGARPPAMPGDGDHDRAGEASSPQP